MLLNYAHLAEHEGKRALAIWANKQALAVMAWGDDATQQLGPEFRSAWASQYRERYESLTRRLIEAGRLAEATALERVLKAEEFERFRSDAERGAQPHELQPHARAHARLRVLAQRERVRYRALLADAARLAVAGRRGTEHMTADHATDHGARGLALRECKG